MSEPEMRVRFGAATHPGLVRSSNEDSYLTVPPVFLVADGMGGHSNGAAASSAVVDAFALLATQPWLTSDDVVTAVDRAANAIKAMDAGGKAPGSTVTGVGLTQQAGMPCWLVFNVGDSRTHLLRDGDLTQISIDHSAAVRLAADGPAPPARNAITRALGAGLSRPVADQWLIPALAGDRVLICSDGLTNEVTKELLMATLMSADAPQEAVQLLQQAALTAGGHDNVTAVVVDCDLVISTAVHNVAAEDSTASSEVDDTVPDLPTVTA